MDGELRDKIRAHLGLPQRPRKTEINRAEHARSVGIDRNPKLQPKASKPAHRDEALQSLKFPDELERLMEKLSSDTRLAEQEMGISTLFLAFGFLEWYKIRTESDKKTFAPLLLLPIKLDTEQNRGRKVYSLSTRENVAESSLSLRKLLEKQFNRKLPDLEASEDETTVLIEAYLEQVLTAIRGLPRWQVHRWLVLGHFAFGRFAMYADLDPQNWGERPAEHILVQSILQGTKSAGEDTILPSVPQDYPIDEPEIEKLAPILIHDADASQHSALIDVMCGKNLVIQGPPGTGKSQTITNIIANTIAAGNTVLFLAEKQAALEVVKRRLNAAGLGEFCLELHSEKSSPKFVIESLKKRALLPKDKRLSPSNHPDGGWLNSRKQLKDYLLALHAEQPDGRTVYEMIWTAIHGISKNADVANAIRSFPVPDNLLSSVPDRASVVHNLEIFVNACNSFITSYGYPAASPWAKFVTDDFPSHKALHLVEPVRNCRCCGQRNLSDSRESNHQFGLHTIADIDRIIKMDRWLGDGRVPRLVSQVAHLDIKEIGKTLSDIAELQQLSGALTLQHDCLREQRAKIAIAPMILQVAPSFKEKTPSAAYRLANETIRNAVTLINYIEGLTPVFTLLETNYSEPAGTLFPLAVAVSQGATVRPQHQVWLHAYRGIDAAEFSALNKRWATLASNERNWRRSLSVFGPQPWPTAEKLDATATTLKKVGISKLLAALKGSVKAANEFVMQFELQSSSDVVNTLSRLADHVRAIRAFEDDVVPARLFWLSMGWAVNSFRRNHGWITHARSFSRENRHRSAWTQSG